MLDILLPWYGMMETLIAEVISPLVSRQKKGCSAITLSSHFLLFPLYNFGRSARGAGLQSGIS